MIRGVSTDGIDLSSQNAAFGGSTGIFIITADTETQCHLYFSNIISLEGPIGAVTNSYFIMKPTFCGIGKGIKANYINF